MAAEKLSGPPCRPLSFMQKGGMTEALTEEIRIAKHFTKPHGAALSLCGTYLASRPIPALRLRKAAREPWIVTSPISGAGRA